MGIKLYDSELKVMEILWKEGELTAGHIAKILKEEIGWNRNTTYTVIKNVLKKVLLKDLNQNSDAGHLFQRKMHRNMRQRNL